MNQKWIGQALTNKKYHQTISPWNAHLSSEVGIIRMADLLAIGCFEKEKNQSLS